MKFTSALIWTFISSIVFLVGESSAQPAPVITDSIRQGKPSIALEIESRFAEANLGRQARIAVSVLDLQRGSTVVDVNSGTPLTPASLMKIVSAATTLDTLGPDRKFTTRVVTPGTVEKNILYGDLIIVGGGDPSLGPRFQSGRRSVTGLLDNWAKELRSKGIRTIEGNIIGDDTRYPRDPIAIGWDQREYAEWYSAEVSALNYNENVLDVIWRSGSKVGDRPALTIQPQTDYASIGSTVRIGPADQRVARIRYTRFLESNEIRARGSMPANSQKYDFAAIHDPARYTATLLMEALKRNGITVKGVALSARDLGPSTAADSDHTILIEHQSPPISEMLPIVLGDSHNLYAEVLLREAALATGREGSFKGATETATQWLLRKRLHRSGFTMLDGSGLSSINRMPARLASEVLRERALSTHGSLWRSALATPDRRSLVNRFVDDEVVQTTQSLQAKTGYTTGVHSLAGYFTAPSGREYVFTVIITDYDPERLIRARDLLDELVASLCENTLLD